jgi:hypothetical protein
MPKPSRNPLKRVVDGIAAARERHEARRRPSGFRFALADRVGFLNPIHWDSVTGHRRFFLRRSVLEAIELNCPANLSPRYALLYDEDTPVAAVAAQMVDISGASVWSGPEEENATKGRSLSRALAPAAQRLVAQLEQRVLVAGNLMSWGFNGIAFADGINPTHIWPGIAEALYRIRRAENLAGQTDLILVKDVTPDEPHAEALRTFSYRPLETEPNMVLQIDPTWRSYDDYLGALDAKYRRNSRDQIKKLAAAGCTMEPLSDITPHAAEIHRLYRAVQSKASVKLVSLPESFLPALARAEPDHFRCTIIRRGEEVLGFISCLRDGDTAIGYYIGFDRDAAAGGIPLYLRLLHTTIDDAIRWGCKRLSLGRTALEPKAALGAKPESMSVWLRHRVPSMNWLVRGMLDAVPHAEAPERNPFKSARSDPSSTQPKSDPGSGPET